MNEDIFKTSLFQTRYFNDTNNSPIMIADKINRINLFFENIDDKTKLVPGRDMLKKTNVKYLNKAIELSFYLSLDEKLRWIKLLDIDEIDWKKKWLLYWSLK
jgi:hypothetical protein